MMCPECQSLHTRVLDSRQCKGKGQQAKYLPKDEVRRRRQCKFCDHTFSTSETIINLK